MAQTPQQRKANEKYARQEATKRGRPEGAAQRLPHDTRSPLSPIWIGLLAFVVAGGLLFELLRLFF